jgi:hypothetical protein
MGVLFDPRLVRGTEKRQASTVCCLVGRRGEGGGIRRGADGRDEHWNERGGPTA